MLKKLFFFIIISLINIEFFSNEAYADCNFKTGNFSEKLSKPNSIKSISIKVNNSKKYSINSIKALLSNSGTGWNIDPKYKKKYKANITVNYNFGSCEFKGKIWQNGDWKDHLKPSEGGKVIRSLNVKIEDGNILNATKFKLLIPETRNGKNEILASLILNELGIISPETAMVFVDVNNVKSEMIFQEDSQKELLERNNRREGPIFEGDESIMMTDEDYLRKKQGKTSLELISLSRLINTNWFVKGNSSQQITLSALSSLQDAYLEYTDLYVNEKYFINPNKKNNDIFTDYHFLMLSMNGRHGLRPHNRKYYFNSFTNSFEPIYYDGGFNNGFKFKLDDKDGNGIDVKTTFQTLSFPEDYNFPLLERINQEDFQAKIRNKFKNRVRNFDSADERFFKKSFGIFKSNASEIQRMISSNSNYFSTSRNNKELRKSFLDRNSETKTEKNIIKNYQINKELISLELEDGRNFNTDIDGLSRIISRKNLNGERYLFLPNRKVFNSKDNLKKTLLVDFGAEIIHPYEMKIIFKRNNTIPRLLISQYKPNQSVLIKGGNLENLEIIFQGLRSEDEIQPSNQRFNTRGLTGCLNIYNSNLKNVSILVENGHCEDSLNIVNSAGNLNSLIINNAYQDAVDLDFSDISINKTIINNAGNDCFDVSGGKYQILSSEFLNCSDKGLSVGEKSKFSAEQLYIDNANIGIAIKDLSTFKGKNVSINNSKNCIQIFQKKLEFGGAYGEIEKLDCSGEFYIDKDSTLIF